MENEEEWATARLPLISSSPRRLSLAGRSPPLPASVSPDRQRIRGLTLEGKLELGSEDFGRRFVVETLARTAVDPAFDVTHGMRRKFTEVGVFGPAAAQDPRNIFPGTLFPTVIGVAEKGTCAQRAINAGVFDVFRAVVEGN